MWRSRASRDRKTVVCIACGTSLLRSEAREYDKEGDRWDRQGKEFEHLCKECDAELTRQPRDGLEDRLEAAAAGSTSREEFLASYLEAVEDDASTGENEQEF